VISGDATLSSGSSQTDQNGLSQITFTYGTTPGPIMIEASLPRPRSSGSPRTPARSPCSGMP
jgi:hypothetical protein